MAKIKFTKTELKKQQDAQKQFKRFLPTLQLKKQQLQMEVRQSTEMLNANLAAQRELVERMTGLLELFGDAGAAAFIADHVKVKSVRKGSSNIAGITIPTFESVEFENIRRIRIMLGDLDPSAVARCKIAKRKSAEAASF